VRVRKTTTVDDKLVKHRLMIRLSRLTSDDLKWLLRLQSMSAADWAATIEYDIEQGVYDLQLQQIAVGAITRYLQQFRDKRPSQETELRSALHEIRAEAQQLVFDHAIRDPKWGSYLAVNNTNALDIIRKYRNRKLPDFTVARHKQQLLRLERVEQENKRMHEAEYKPTHLDGDWWTGQSDEPTKRAASHSIPKPMKTAVAKKAASTRKAK
jgi:hypothetical protein